MMNNYTVYPDEPADSYEEWIKWIKEQVKDIEIKSTR